MTVAIIFWNILIGVKMISVEQKQRALKLYRNKNITIPEISNLTDISIPKLSVLFRQAFEMGVLKPRDERKALKSKVPSGQGAKKPKTHEKAGNPNFRPKYTKEQEKEIALDYYERGYTLAKLKEKWKIHPMQLQHIREVYGNNYDKKEHPNKRAVLQFDKQGNFIAEFDSVLQASKQTNTRATAICLCCNHTPHYNSANGFVWEYKQC